MPIYEYKCTKCNEQFEVAQKMTDEPLAVHESCGGELKKIITNTSFVLKGSGWYVTDYPSADRKKAMDSEKPGDKKKDKKTEKKSETKTEKKAEPAKAR
ncbi:MAG: zinc ribbon domain-containing protein [Nitrospiraceae bacterium]|nr:MAG: zinc ribbon domain-containing protein [Nitrospiraceae bacterium]